MEYLQYTAGLKPPWTYLKVLNLVINGIPSILYKVTSIPNTAVLSFKPCYKWNTFNTEAEQKCEEYEALGVLNLVINGIPSIRKYELF